MSICTDVILIEKLDNSTDILEVTIDDTTKSLMIYSYGEALAYVGHSVVVSYRKDIYQGIIRDFINTISIPTIVHTLEKEDNIKLYIDQEDSFANMCFNDLKDGEFQLNAEVYCVKHYYESSPNATWAELVVRDKSMRLAKLRLFDYDASGYNYSGQYIKADIRKTKYGLVTKFITPLNPSNVLNPEVTIAKTFILNTFSGNQEVLDIISNTNLLEYMEQYVDIEKGYLLVRIAMELAMTKEISNVTNSVNTDNLVCAILFSRLHVLSPGSDYSNEFCNMVSLSKEKLSNKKDVMLLLDSNPINVPEEKEILNKIMDVVNTFIKIRKGL